MGVSSIDCTPKCHCDLAGEGIEYSWGCAENLYCQKPLSQKRKKETFRATVTQHIPRDNHNWVNPKVFKACTRLHLCLLFLAPWAEQKWQRDQQHDNDDDDDNQLMQAKHPNTSQDWKTRKRLQDSPVCSRSWSWVYRSNNNEEGEGEMTLTVLSSMWFILWAVLAMICMHLKKSCYVNFCTMVYDVKFGQTF